MVSLQSNGRYGIVVVVSVILSMDYIAFADEEYCKSYPAEVQACFNRAEGHPFVDIDLAKMTCLKDFYEGYRHRHVLTAEDRAFVKQFVDSGFGHNPPESGFRLRREIRTLTDEERDLLWNVLSAMYWNGTIARFGRLHHSVWSTIHKGAAFLPFHRILLLHFEEEMRKIDPNVSLPYWDYSMDNNITRRRDSVVWSDCFFGDTRGDLRSGHFAGWYGGNFRPLRRNAARRGWMISKWDIGRLLKFCHFRDITTGGRRAYFNNFDNLEVLHDDVHDWIGGDVGSLSTAPYDPVFWMHHAFIDLIWELFRENQIYRCKVDPETDYRPLDDLTRDGQSGHEPHSPMPIYSHLRNIDGLWRNWTQEFFNYEPLPMCPNCGGSDYLYCNREFGPQYPDGLCLTKKIDACLE